MNVVPADTWNVAPVAMLILPNLVKTVLPDVVSLFVKSICVPLGIVNASVVLKHSLRSVLGVLLIAVANPLIPVKLLPSPTNFCAVTIPVGVSIDRPSIDSLPSCAWLLSFCPATTIPIYQTFLNI